MQGHAAAIRLILSLCGFAVMLFIETLRPKRSWKDSRLRRLFFHMGLSLFNSVLLSGIAAAPFLFWAGLISSRNWGLASWAGLHGPLEILVSLVVLDMFNYWWHRWNHEVKFLWRFHKVHHVDTHVDVTTSLRFHPGELLISSMFIKILWLFIWGPSLMAFIIFEGAIGMAAQFHHSNIDFSDKAEVLIRKIFVTPRFHAGHHTVSQRTGNANYSTIFIFWDRLFRTYGEPDAEELKHLGLARGRETYLSFLATMKAPFTSNY